MKHLIVSVSLVVVLAVGVMSAPAAHADLVIHAAELGVAKFHRMDNKLHPYGSSHAWAPVILPDGATPENPPLLRNANGSYTIFFTSLENLLHRVLELVSSTGEPVKALDIHAHGLPGGTWFPTDEAARKSEDCAEWEEAANGPDETTYNEYYHLPNAEQVLDIRNSSRAPQSEWGCTTGAKGWKKVIQRLPALPAAFASNASVRFVSCVVGLGTAGEHFSRTVAELLFAAKEGRVETTVNFGLGDWSLPEGMGFWDYQSAEQMQRDVELAAAHQDRQYMQPGIIRLTLRAAGRWTSRYLADQPFMLLGWMPLGMELRFPTELPWFRLSRETFSVPEPRENGAVPRRLRIPGTARYAERLSSGESE